MNVAFAPVAGAAPEGEIARDIARRGLMAAPAVLAVSGLLWGVDGALSSAFALGLVIVNFLVAAWLLTTAGRISLALLMGATLGGYILRLGLITLAVLLVKDQAWVELVPLGLTLIVCHLGLLAWETRYVSASLAHPGLKPSTGKLGSTKE